MGIFLRLHMFYYLYENKNYFSATQQCTPIGLALRIIPEAKSPVEITKKYIWVYLRYFER